MVSSKVARAPTFAIVLAVVLVAVAWGSPPAAAEEPALEIQWVHQFGTAGVEVAHAVTVESTGVYVAGSVNGVLAGQSRTSGSSPRPLEAVGDTLFFAAGDGVNGHELWKSDGTEAGTVLVKDIRSGSYGSLWVHDRSAFTAVGDVLFFAAWDGVHHGALWKSDGTEAGTVLVKDIWPTDIDEIRLPEYFTAVGGTLFFRAYDGVHGWELWKSDGTEAGTVLVKDIWPGSEGSGPYRLTAVGDILFFTANDGVHGRGLWKSDGTEAGTVLVKDIRPGGLTAVDGTLFFPRSESELWKSDGTEAGTVLVKDIRPGQPLAYPRHLTAMGNTLFFVADDGLHGRELWKSDGTEDGTVLVKDIWPGSGGEWGPDRFASVGDTLFFRADDGARGPRLWRSDGTEDGTAFVKDVDLWRTSEFGDMLLFVGSDGHGWNLWRSDGTADGTVLVKGVWPTSIRHLTAVGNTLFFSAGDGVHGEELWKSDGTADGTVLVKDINTGSPAYGDFVWGDAFVRRYDHDGNVLWTQQFDQYGMVGASAVSVDATGVYVASPAIDVSVFHRHLRVYKLDLNGNWLGTLSPRYEGSFNAIDVDATGVYVVGTRRSGVGNELVVQKYGHDGNILWTGQPLAGGASDDIAVDPSGVYVVGLRSIDGEVAQSLHKYDLDGSILWTRELKGYPFQYDDFSSAPYIAADVDQKGVYVAGTRWTDTGFDALLEKYDADGNLLWTRQFGRFADEVVHSIKADSSGAYIAGERGGTHPGQTSGSDAFLRKYDPDGNLLWTGTLGTLANDSARDVALGASAVYVTGVTRGTFEGQTGTGGQDAFVVAFGETSGAPSNVQATLGGGAIVLSWDPPAFEGRPSASSYRVYRGTDAESLELVAVLDSTPLRYEDRDVVGGNTYYYRVSAVNDVGEGPASAISQATAAKSHLELELDDLKSGLETTQDDLDMANARLAAQGQHLLLGQLGLLGLAITIIFLLAFPRLRGRGGSGQKDDDPTDSSNLNITRPSRPRRPPRSRPASASGQPRSNRAAWSDLRIRLTTKERILLHLTRYRRHAESSEVPLEMSQEGIASAVWINQRHAVQYLRPLIRDGLLVERMAHVPNGSQRRKVYALTDVGRRVALRLGHRVRGESVQVWDGERVWKVRVADVLRKAGRSATVLDVARHLMQAGVVDLAALEAGNEVPFGDEEDETAALGA